MRLFLVRHGTTDWTEAGRLQGHAPVSLNAAGRSQASLLAKRLIEVPLAAIYSSDLPRTAETAAILAKDKQLKVIETADLREQSYGQWEGMTFNEIRSAYPAKYRQWQNRDEGIRPPGGESLGELEGRVSRLLALIRQTYSEDTSILLVGHGGSLQSIAKVVLELSIASRRRLNLATGSLSILSVSEAGSTLDLWNDVSHLAAM